jgi:hypothetical protein
MAYGSISLTDCSNSSIDWLSNHRKLLPMVANALNPPLPPFAKGGTYIAPLCQRGDLMSPPFAKGILYRPPFKRGVGGIYQPQAGLFALGRFRMQDLYFLFDYFLLSFTISLNEIVTTQSYWHLSRLTEQSSIHRFYGNDDHRSPA